MAERSVDRTPKMRRRPALRRALLLAFGMALGKLDVLKAQHGELRVPLDQWEHIIFEHRGKRVVVSVAGVFDALREG